MRKKDVLDEIDYDIMRLRMIGMEQTEIAKELKMAQSTISERWHKIRRRNGFEK